MAEPAQPTTASIVTDGQAHIWLASTPKRPWPVVGGVTPHGPASFRACDLTAQMDLAAVNRAVLVPPSFEGDRNDLVCAAARAHPTRFKVMARLSLGRATARDDFEELIDDPSVRGFRFTFHTSETARWLDDGTADWVWPAIAHANLAVMVFAPGKFREIARLCESYPTTRIILDTLGLSADMRDCAIDPYLAKLIELACFPNLAVKAVALPNYVSDAYPYRSLAIRVRNVLDAFGPERLFWASDLTRARCTYRENVGFLRDLDVMSSTELDWVMGRGISTWLEWS